MLQVINKKRSKHTADELAKREKETDDYLEKSLPRVSMSVDDLEKHLWIANGPAAVASITWIQTTTNTIFWQQYVGACLFVSGILMLVIIGHRYAVVDVRLSKGCMARHAQPDLTDYRACLHRLL